MQQIVDKAEIVLQDVTNVTWDSTELLGWANDGQRVIVANKPNSYIKNQNLLLIAGTKQAIPSDGIQLIKVTRNMGTAGTTPGNAIWLIEQNRLDEQRPGWHSETAAATVKHAIFDPRDPKTFYVYPQQPATGQGYVEIVYSATPTDIAIGATILIDDIYSTSLMDYILYRAYSKDADYAANDNRAAGALNVFLASLNGRVQAENIYDPNMSGGSNTKSGGA